MKNYLNKLKNCLLKIKTYVISHKKVSIIVLIIILLLGFWIYKKVSSTSGETRYVIAAVQKGTIISSVSGTGQVSASNQVDLKAKVSGDIVSIGVKSGQKVSKGTLITQIDSGDKQKSVRDAELSLQSAKISLEKFKIQNSKENVNADLQKTYDDGFADISDASIDLPSVLTGLQEVLSESNLSDNAARSVGRLALDYRNQAEKLYYSADDALDEVIDSFRGITRDSSPDEIESVINNTYDAVKILSDALKSTKNFVDYMIEDTENYSDFVLSQNSLAQYISTVDSHLSSLYSAKQNIEDYKDDFSTTDLDLESSEISVQQKENTLKDLQEELADYSIRAPFDGTVADIAVEKSDSVSSGTVIATFITKSQVAEISLNEVDMAMVEVGQKAELTFDAVPELMISGEVSEIDSIGTESQGVVTYNIKINFDNQDDRIKSGMSVSASIITNLKKDILNVPNSAIKSKNGSSYVEQFSLLLQKTNDGLLGSVSKNAPNKIPVKVGISNDSQTEIISGLKEGDEIVVKTILSTTKTTTTTPSMFGSSGGNKDGGLPGH